jgi:hypothetical protein
MNQPDQPNPQMIQRREILTRAAWLLGGAVSAPAALAILQGCSAQQGEPTATTAWTPQLLNGHEVDVITAIADIMIPKTDTSGALDAGVPAFIDSVLAAVYPPDAQARFKAGCAEFESAARTSGKAFLEQQSSARTVFVKQSLEAALAADHDPKPFILMTRELTLLGFFTSKVGITENMEYVPVPTVFHGCVPLSQMKKHVYWE